MTTSTPRPCILTGGLVKLDPDYDERVSADRAPRTDFIELARRLDAAIPAHPLAESRLFKIARTMEGKASLDASMAAWIAHRASRYSVIVSLSEKVGIPLALALRTLGRRTPHVLIGHKLSWPVQRMAWTLTGAQRGFAAVACVSREQLEFTRKPSGMGIDAGHFVYDKVDERFFRPRRVDDDGYVLAVGQEQRDYATLVKAMDGLGKRLVIVASSPWTMSRLPPPEPSAQIDVLAGIPFTELRDLYARARLVVVPVHDVDFAAGVNGLLEGMAMARPVICSRTRGLDGYVDDGVTGVLVPPCDAPALRETIRELWDDRAHRSRLQDAGRAAVEAGMTLDHYVGRMATLAANASSQPPS